MKKPSELKDYSGIETELILRCVELHGLRVSVSTLAHRVAQVGDEELGITDVVLEELVVARLVTLNAELEDERKFVRSLLELCGQPRTVVQQFASRILARDHKRKLKRRE